MNYPAWQLKKADPAAETSLAGAGCGVLLRRVLAARGCTDPAAAQALLGQGEPLSDPFLLTDMDKAVVRIQEAIENEELMVIYGDYDVDGISATAILYECLTSQGAHVRCKLPTRGSGYGLTRAALESLASKGFKLVVTVDNGISAVEEATCAKELGLDLIITDHHLPGDTLPDAIAVVDPKRLDDESPFKDLCGAGVAFKLCAALEGCDPAELLEMYGELAALGTVADVMPLVGENRTIVREGLSLLQDTMRPGLHALLESAGCGGKPVTADTVSYSLAPRLNAAGRMDNAAVALKLLLCGDEDQATGIAERLAEINTERQQTEQEVFAAAQKTLEADPARQRDRVLVVSGEDWHPGVIGIVAARLMEKYNRPAIVISLQNGEGRGSGRAPDPFDLHGALAGCAQYLTRFGGHAAAAGVEIEEEKLPAFRQAINAWAAEHAPRPGAPELKLDAAVQLSELTLPNVQELSRLAPFGRENPMPVLLVCDAMIDGIWPMGAEGCREKEMASGNPAENPQKRKIHRRCPSSEDLHGGFLGKEACSKCGDIYRRVVWNNRGKRSIVWRCCTRVEHGPGACNADAIHESELQNLVVRAINMALGQKDTMYDVLQRNVEAVLTGTDGISLDEIDARLEELQRELLNVANAKGNYDSIVDEIYMLREAKQNAQVEGATREGMKQRISEMQQFLAEQTQDITEYDEQLVRRLIEKITVYDEKVIVEFKSGINVDIHR